MFVSFGAWVQERRGQLRLTRKALADRVACSPAMIKKIERDERRPSLQIAELLAQHLNVSPAEQDDFVRRARGEYVEAFGMPVEVEPAGPPTKHNLPREVTSFIGRENDSQKTA